MARWVRWNNPTIKPPFGAQIDWSNPIGSLASSIFLLNEFGSSNCYDLLTKTPANLGWNTSWKGGGIYSYEVTSNAIGVGLESVPIPYPKLTDATIILYANIKATGNFQDIVGWRTAGYDDYRFFVRSPNTAKLQFYLNTSGGHGNFMTDVKIQNPTFIALTYNGYLAKGFYELDGKLKSIASTDFSGPLKLSPSLFNIGASSGRDTDVPNAYYYTAYIFNRALNNSEIEQLHHEPYSFFLYPQYWYLVDFGGINSKEYSSLYDILNKNEYNNKYNIQTKTEKNIKYDLLAQNSYISKYDLLTKKETSIIYDILAKANYNIIYDLLNTHVKEIIYDILTSKEYNSKYDLLNSLSSTILYDILTSFEKSINYNILNTIKREILYDILAANHYNVGYNILKSTTKNILYDILLKSEYNVIYDILGSNIAYNIVYDILTSNESDVVYDILAKNESQVRYNILTKSKYSAVYDILNSKQYGSIYNILNKNEVNIIYDILRTLSAEYTIVYDILKSKENIIRYDILDSIEKTIDYNILNNINYECLYDILKTNSYDILYDVLISKLYEVLYDVNGNIVIIEPKVTLKRKSFINTLIKNTSKIRQQIVFKSKINKS